MLKDIKEIQEIMLYPLIKDNPSIFKDITNPSNKLCRIAVEADGMNLQFVPEEHFTYKIICEAIENNSHAILFLHEKNDVIDENNDYILECVKSALKSDPSIYKDLVDIYKTNFDMAKTAIEASGENIQYVKGDTFNKDDYNSLCLLVVKNQPDSIRYICNVTENIIWEAIKVNPSSIIYVSNIATRDMWVYAFKNIEIYHNRFISRMFENCPFKKKMQKFQA